MNLTSADIYFNEQMKSANHRQPCGHNNNIFQAMRALNHTCSCIILAMRALNHTCNCISLHGNRHTCSMPESQSLDALIDSPARVFHAHNEG